MWERITSIGRLINIYMLKDTDENLKYNSIYSPGSIGNVVHEFLNTLWKLDVKDEGMLDRGRVSGWDKMIQDYIKSVNARMLNG